MHYRRGIQRNGCAHGGGCVPGSRRVPSSGCGSSSGHRSSSGEHGLALRGARHGRGGHLSRRSPRYLHASTPEEVYEDVLLVRRLALHLA